MIKYAQINDEEKHTVNVVDSEPSDPKVFIDMGFSRMDVEQGYDGNWYLVGYVPKKPEDIVIYEKIQEEQKFLNETDWYVVRFAETGVEIPVDIKERRAKARIIISELRG